jgi:predicted GNAT family N-acyltransferase
MTPASRPPDIVVSIADTAADREACLALRYRVYISEMKCPAPGADHARMLDLTAEDDQAIHVGAWIGRELIGTLRIFHGARGFPESFVKHAKAALRSGNLSRFRKFTGTSPSEVAVISRLAIDPGHRGGTAIVSLFRESFRLLMEQHPKTRLIFILAMDNPRLLALYRMLGFERLDEHLLYPSDLGPTVPMCAKLIVRASLRDK